MNYKQYLQSDYWKELRETKIMESNGRCQKCKRTSNLQVHHLTYDRKGCERLSDLMVLCERCHEKAHNLFPVYVDDWKPILKIKNKAKKAIARERPVHPLFKYVKPINNGTVY
jgi:5-methylcytosine-specific restriction endonuclease McrA